MEDLLEPESTFTADVRTARRGPTYVRAVLAVLAWGASFIATKVALRELPVGTVIWIRFGIGTLVMAGIVALRRESLRLDWKTIAALCFLGVLGISFHQWLQVNGLKTASASTSAWIITTSPVFIAILGRLLLREHLDWKRAAGICLAACGVLLVISNGEPWKIVSGGAGGVGDYFVLASAANWAVFSVASRRILHQVSPTTALLFVMGAGWLCSSVLLPFPRELWREIMATSSASWIALSFLGVICSGAAYIFWYDALKVLPVVSVGALLYLEPIVAMAVAAIVLGEDIHASALAGGALIIGGVWLVNTPEDLPGES